ncbi:MAG: HAD family hydrolase [Anaerolineae bacterium]|nr:HAD family hydrolase [Anaerolineae bacterium]
MFNPDSIDALLFDLDGTLMDSDDQAVAALAQRLTRLGFKNPQRAARRFVMLAETPGNSALTVLDMVGLDNLFTGLSNRVHRWRGAPSPANFAIIPGCAEAVRHLAGRYRLGVVTTRAQREAEAFLEQFEIRSQFEIVVSRESTWRIKPHPAPVRYASRALGLPPERCAMVGDTTVDVLSARRAGAWAVAVLCGFGELEELQRVQAHLILDSPADLPAIMAPAPETSL